MRHMLARRSRVLLIAAAIGANIVVAASIVHEARAQGEIEACTRDCKCDGSGKGAQCNSLGYGTSCKNQSDCTG